MWIQDDSRLLWLLRASHNPSRLLVKMLLPEYMRKTTGLGFWGCGGGTVYTSSSFDHLSICSESVTYAVHQRYAVLCCSMRSEPKLCMAPQSVVLRDGG